MIHTDSFYFSLHLYGFYCSFCFLVLIFKLFYSLFGHYQEIGLFSKIALITNSVHMMLVCANGALIFV